MDNNLYKIEEIKIIKPVLKWVGGKTQIINDVLLLFPNKINNYYEPFLGGGSVLLGLLSYIKYGKIKILEKIYASDINHNLIALYKNIQKYSTDLINELKKITQEFNNITENKINRKASNIEEALTSQESYYFWIRTKFNKLSKEDKETPMASAMLLFMNKVCFRGVYREGPNGFNVPFGNYKNPSIFDEEHIKKVSELIKDVIFINQNFIDALSFAKKDDFIYLDPPYAPQNTKSFVSYTSNGFDINNHKSLFNICKTMNSKDIKFLMSNSDVKLVKDTFDSSIYQIKNILCKRTINSKKPQSKTNELLITNQ
jgi:DNA adenine methylase